MIADNLFKVNETLIGSHHQKAIENSRVAVVGAGGLGCCVLQSLVRLGVEHLTIIDADKVEASNLPRQVLFTKEDIGKNKAGQAKKSLLRFSNQLHLKTHIEYLNTNNGANLLKDHDVVFDCTDNFTGRYAISKVCKYLNIPTIYGGVNKFEGQVGVFNFEGSRSFHELFPDYNSLVESETCEASGVLPFLVQIIGNFQVVEFFKMQTNSNELLNNKFMSINLLSGKQRIIKLKTLS